MNDDSLERLHYFNGQRLLADDLRTEQDYHLRVRRWLNRALYTSGIATGLEVVPVPGKLPQVRVMPGLALDPLGREIILLEPRTLDVMHDIGGGAKAAAPCITIRYDEQLGASQAGVCSADAAPSRIIANPVLECLGDLPHPASGKIVLGLARLGPGCATVDSVDASVRRYVGADSAAKVRQYALEGERDIDARNPGRIRFHVRGREPTSVTLVLRAERFPTLYYSEMGRHTHGAEVTIDDVTVPGHSHPISKIPDTNGTGMAGGHGHPINDIRALSRNVAVNEPHALVIELAILSLPLLPPPHLEQSLKSWTGMKIDMQDAANHSHSLPARTDESTDSAVSASGQASLDDAGVADEVARMDPSDQSLAYVEGMRVWLTHGESAATDVTDAVLAQIRRNYPTETWTQLGMGSRDGAELLATKGTRDIRLDMIPGAVFGEGEHLIELTVPAGGGRVHFNLYVE